MNIPNFYELLNQGYSLDQIYLLLEMKRGVSGFPVSPRVRMIIQFLIRKGLCTEEFTVTMAGEEVIKMMLAKEAVTLVKRSRDEAASYYARWLKAFPVSDGFSYRGKTFPKTRVLRRNTEKCRELFHKLMREGEYTCDDLCRAIIAESLAKMDNSIRQGENKMSYITNSESYLRQRIFEGFMEDGRALRDEQITAYYEAIGRKGRIIDSNNTVDI